MLEVMRMGLHVMPNRVRYPQHDAATPDEARARLEEYDVEEATVDALLGGHARALFGF